MVPPAPWPSVQWAELLGTVPDEEQDFELWMAYQRATNFALSHPLDEDPWSGEREPEEYRRFDVHPVSLPQSLVDLREHAVQSNRQALVRSCLEISLWGERNGYGTVALRFAEVAAACEPYDPVPASVAGRIARTAGLGLRAEEWFRRSIALARSRHWSASYVRAHIGFGTLMKDRGRLDAALELYQTAGWRAQRSGIRWLAGEVHHDMLLLALGRKAFRRAEAYAARALNIYPVHHDRVPALVHDFSLLCVREFVFDPALSLLQKVLPLIAKPHEKLIVLSTLALSAAGADSASLHDGCRKLVMEMVETYTSSAPPALMNLAFAAHIRGDWAGAAEMANHALAAAGNNALYREQITDAKVLISQVEARTPATPPVLPTYAPGGEQSLRALHAEFSRLITKWHGPTWQGGEQAGPGDFGPV
jgi:tetratricopeptide (TPR) repeat protein